MSELGVGYLLRYCTQDATGLCAWKAGYSGTRTYYLYDGSTPIIEMDGSGNAKAVNTFGANGLISRRTFGTNRWTDTSTKPHHRKRTRIGYNHAVKQDERITIALLGWVAGYMDAAGFLRLSGLFTNHVTGNLVATGESLAGKGESSVWVRLAIIPVFMVGVALVTVLSRRKQVRVSRLLYLQYVLLMAFLVSGVLLVPWGTEPVSDPVLLVTGSLGVLAMSIQNGLMRVYLTKLPPTTIMTGNLTQFTIDAVHLLFDRREPESDTEREQRDEVRARARRGGIVLLSFVVGAALGTYLMFSLGFWSIVLPAAAILFLAILTGRLEKRQESVAV